jgi:ABC-type antimicrobial peptide transport system permease subunit
MFQNYFKIAWRNLFRNKSFSLMNLVGLIIGITCTMLILLWVNDELSYDKFQENYHTTFKVMANRNFNNQIFTDDAIIFPLAGEVENNFPQVKNAVVTSYSNPAILSFGDIKLKKSGYIVSQHYFNIFSWTFIKGNAVSAITEPNSIVLTQSAAHSLFGTSEPVGKVIKINNDKSVKVTAIVADVPANSTLQFDYIIPYNFSDENVQKNLNDWKNSFSNVFIQTIPDADLKALEKNINTLTRQHDPTDKVSTYFLHPMNKWRLYSNFKEGKNVGGMIEYVRLFTGIAFIILLIACVNFMNLSTARSEKRAKEVGIRKTLGSDKRQLILQFFLESMTLAFIAFIFSLVAVFLLLPSFNLLVNKKLILPLDQPVFWLAGIGVTVFTGIVAGSYPALYLSSFNPVKVLKGTFLAGKQAIVPRRILVVSQFIISILLISATIIIYQQIQYVKNREIGYNPNNLIMIPSTPETDKSFDVIREELLKSGFINSVTRTSAPITDIWNYSPSPDWPEKPTDQNIIFAALRAGDDFTKTFGIQIKTGRDFSPAFVSDSSAILLNEAAVKIMNIKNPIGMQVKYGPNPKNYTIIGVIDNVVMSSPYKPVDPMIIFYNTDQSNFISIRLNKTVKPQQVLNFLKTTFGKYNPAFPFEYQFTDQEFGKKFSNEELISRLTNIFAGLAIFICCIGLAGLASFTIEKRIREIGIRKVLGASVQQLLLLISKEFIRLVMIAFVIAVPITWWAMNSWLAKYDYHKSISLWLFAAVGFIMLLLTLVVVSANTLSAAIKNPVKSLRNE